MTHVRVGFASPNGTVGSMFPAHFPVVPNAFGRMVVVLSRWGNVGYCVPVCNLTDEEDDSLLDILPVPSVLIADLVSEVGQQFDLCYARLLAQLSEGCLLFFFAVFDTALWEFPGGIWITDHLAV